MAVNNNDFVEALNICIDRLNDGEMVDAVVQDYPAIASQLRPMLEAGRVSRRAKFSSADVQAARDRAEPDILEVIDTTFGGGFSFSGGMIIPIIIILIISGTFIGLMMNRTSGEDVIIPTGTVNSELTLSGEIIRLSDGTLSISGIRLDLSAIESDISLEEGMLVEVRGQLSDNSILVSEINLPEQSPVLDSTETSSQEMLFVIEGPVSAINNNRIEIYGFEIIVEQDLALSVMQIGDVVRIEASSDTDELRTVNISFISVTVVIIDGQVWRDTGTCDGLPDWIPEDDAQDYLIRCTSQPGNNNTNFGSSSQSDNDDDDD